MTSDTLFMVLIFGAISNLVIACFCGHLASEKKHSTPTWFFLGLLFGFIALIAAAGLPTWKEEPPKDNNVKKSWPGDRAP